MRLCVNEENLGRLLHDLETQFLAYGLNGVPLSISYIGKNADEDSHWFAVTLNKHQVRYLMKAPQITLEERYHAR